MMRVIPLFVLLALGTQCCVAQSFDQALALFKQNKRTEARTTAMNVDKQSREYTDALLLATLIDLDNGHIDKAVGDFTSFFKLHPNPYPYLYAFWSRGLFTRNTSATSDEVKRMMTDLLTDPKANATIRSMAAIYLGNKLAAGNDLKNSRRMFEKLCDIKNWATVGSFDNLSSNGFDKDYGVLGHPEADFKFKNKVGADVQWFNISDARTDRWLDLEYNYDVTNAVEYAQTFLTSETDQDLILLLGVSGSVKVWINDFPVASEQEERNTDLDVYAYQVKLQKGTNRVLIQIGSSEINRANFMVRFANLNGELLPAFKSNYAFLPYTKAQPYTVKKLPAFAERFFEEKLESKNSTLLDKLMLSSVYGNHDKRYENRRLLKQLKAEAPKNTVVSEACIEAYSKDNNNPDLTREIELLKTTDPESLVALMYLYEDAIKKETYDEATKLLARRIELYGTNEETQLANINLLVLKKDFDKAIREIGSALNTYPNNLSFVVLQYKLEKDAYKNTPKAIKVLENYLKNNASDDLYQTLLEDRGSLGKKGDGLSDYKKLVEGKPYATTYYSKIATKYYESQDYKNSSEWMQKAVDIAPYMGNLHYSKGLILDAAGKKEEAKAALRDAVKFSPNNYDARKKLLEMEGKTDLFGNFQTDDIIALFKNSPAAADYPNDNSIYLLKDLKQVIYKENGASEERHEILVKIFNKAGIEDWKQVNIGYNPYVQRMVIDKAEILKKDGTRVEAEENDGQVVFSSLEIGDAIHVNYKLENSVSGKLAEHFSEEFIFNSGYPVKLSRFSIIVPESRKFTHKVYNSKLEPVTKQLSDGMKLWVWEKRNNDRFVAEAVMPAFDDVAERIVVSSFPDWSYVANWYSDLSNIKAKADFEIKEKVNELFAGKQHLSELDKARLIYNFIEENFSYSDVAFLHSALVPQRASRTLNSRLGDCKDLSVLFTSMAKEAGLDANLILVDTRDNGDMHLDLPQIAFNHCIAQFKAAGKNYLVELTNNFLPFGALSNTLINANALYIPNDGKAVTNARLVKLNTDNRPLNTIRRNSTIRINGNNAEVSRKSVRSGAESASMRADYQGMSAEDQQKSKIRLLSSEFNNELTLNKLTVSNIDNLDDTVTEEYQFNLTNFTSEIAGMKIIKLPWVDAYTSLELVSLAERKLPLNLWKFSTTPDDVETMTIELPAGKKLVEVPKDLSFSCPALSYKLHFEMKNDRLLVTREVKYLKDEVSVQEYPAFKNVIIKMTEADKQQLAFK